MESQESQTYIFPASYQVPEEATRLDDLHIAITEYFGRQLCLAPIHQLQPNKILELGSGSGAWAIQAAAEFPDAEVHAVDISPMPLRGPLPPNLLFTQTDITQSLPFQSETFDVVHARFFMMHIPNGRAVLQRVAKLVRPGGWLIVEEPDDDQMVNGKEALGPGMSALVTKWLTIVRSRGAEPCIGKELGNILASSGDFSEINIKMLKVPISGKSQDDDENRLGLAWRINMRRVADDLPGRLSAHGVTEKLVQEHLEELEDPGRSITTNMYFSWSRRTS